MVAQASTTMLLFLGHRGKAAWDNKKKPEGHSCPTEKMINVRSVARLGNGHIIPILTKSFILSTYLRYVFYQRIYVMSEFSGQGLARFCWIFDRIAQTAKFVFWTIKWF